MFNDRSFTASGVAELRETETNGILSLVQRTRSLWPARLTLNLAHTHALHALGVQASWTGGAPWLGEKPAAVGTIAVV